MSFDGMFTRATAHELKEKLDGGRISRIHQPYENELIFVIRAKGKNHKLLLSAHPSYSRIQLTEEQYDNPATPPMFCMLLRKHLEGSIIESIEQKEMERIILIEVKGRNEIGDVSYKQLIVEIMGRHSNIILVDKERNMILDSIKHLNPSVNRARTIMPGSPLQWPPGQGKLNPFDVTEDQFLRALDWNSGRLDQQIVQQFSGFSPILAKEVTHRAGLATREGLYKAFSEVIEAFRSHQYHPAFMHADGKDYFYLIPLNHLKDKSSDSFDTLGQLLDRYYFGKAERDRVRQQGHDLERFIKNEKEKNELKIKKLAKTLDQAAEAEKYKLLGELVTANIYGIKKGMKEIEVLNYYEEAAPQITIPLDPRKSPSENAQRYFTKYQKAKNSVDIVKEQISLAEKEIVYFDQLIQQLDSASPSDLEEMREELAEEGYLKAKKNNKKKQKPVKPVLEEYMSSDGTLILVGKNNKQNDYLTNKVAGRDEIWLHTKDIPGSHVVIRDKEPEEKTILEAAAIAAYFSKARASSSVPVDFTKIRHVKKPNGSKPGYVIYEQQETVYVTPEDELIRRLKKK
ncbi:NFACT RNA binding domain-containing protein [Jeotgalibacillus sp. R-1-5s-1]|uniref:Rqc2 family fibronectin-binding protein n=1 Tax=Jeotgalibacillus sp. R-1-5s-1 TaxID=2555897 RepID=UPI00106BCD61|nr:NFACT RNA binding domain-containing protein [Jeotgalibacillus sp. R-1-5s-1]TFE03549.1 fibronectin/fibrinogen-binding protein [Jeotgalibacillus sp. R-1-5s-1]